MSAPATITAPTVAPPALEISQLCKRFGDTQALRGISLSVPKGSVLGLLGPNGAGKTTAVRILSTLLRADSGQVTVAGHDAERDPAGVRRSLGLSGQYASVDENLTGWENLYLVGRLYGISRKASRARAEELLQWFRLENVRDKLAKQYSGGMARRLDIAGALVADPPVVVLDEPTTGLDPRSRMDTWEIVGELVRAGTTVLLTTQYLEEADQLADAIAVIDHGSVVASGSADELKSRISGERLEVEVGSESDLDTATSILQQLGDSPARGEPETLRVSVAIADASRALVDGVQRLHAAGVDVRDVGVRRPSLDDVFLTLTEEASA